MLMPPACLVLLDVVLRHWAAHEVREDFQYEFLFLVAGGAWMAFAAWLMPLANLSFRDDAVERRNGAAAVAVCGALLGATLCFAGSNVGEGETIWTTFLPAVLSIAALFGIWILWPTWPITIWPSLVPICAAISASSAR